MCEANTALKSYLKDLNKNCLSNTRIISKRTDLHVSLSPNFQIVLLMNLYFDLSKQADFQNYTGIKCSTCFFLLSHI